MVVVGTLALPALIYPDPLLAIFLHDPETLALARAPLRLVAAGIAVDVAGMVWMNSLLGAGDSRRVMLVSVAMQWGLNLPLAYLIGPVLGYGLLSIWSIQIGYRCLQAGVFWWLWRRGHWADIEV